MFTIEVEKDIALALTVPYMAEEIFELAMKNKEYLLEWMGWIEDTNDVQDTKNFIDYALKGFANGELLVCSILYKGKIVGAIDLHRMSQTNKKASIGYWLDYEHYGKGIVNKTLLALCKYAFENLQLNKLIILCDKENIKSINVAKRAGFKEEALLRQEMLVNGELRDFYRYALLKEDFKNNHA
jgi:ribosomal-protein-serine acetyltransferase